MLAGQCVSSLNQRDCPNMCCLVLNINSHKSLHCTLFTLTQIWHTAGRLGIIKCSYFLFLDTCPRTQYCGGVVLSHIYSTLGHTQHQYSSWIYCDRNKQAAGRQASRQPRQAASAGRQAGTTATETKHSLSSLSLASFYIFFLFI